VHARTYEAVDLERLLPHRYPFLLVDRVEVLAPGERVRGTKRLTAGEWWSEQHPEQAVPFTLVLEALAQTGGALIPDLKVASGLDGPAVAYFMGADRVRMRRPPRVGDHLILTVELVQWRRGICRTRGVATVSDTGELVLSAELTTIVRRGG
jgi:3-hydroxyacyl-[acyl-carrier-protein] dehydratase